MPMITISERDVKRNVVVEPAWYRVRIDEVGEKTSRAGDSQFYPVEGTILFNGDNGSTQFAGVPTPMGYGFSEKAISFAVGFLDAAGADVSKGGRFELKDAEGKEIDIFIGNGEYGGRTQNKIDHMYRKPKTEVVAQM